MGRFAGEHYPAMDEMLHAPALKPIERDPFEFELVMTQLACDARTHVLGLFLDRRVRIAVELEVDAPDVIWLFVEQRRAAGMERRIEPEPAFGRERRCHLHVGDQELLLEHLSRELRIAFFS